jgi:GntR family transcriptional regulator, transcriptional repressor for pyruvate dehydrogenase complex
VVSRNGDTVGRRRSSSETSFAADLQLRVSPVDLVRSRILHAIETQRLRPGDMLPSERELGEQFGVSRVSVREAIIGLEAVGLLDVQHGRGCYVSESISELVTRPFAVWLAVHREKVIEILKVRAALDGLAAAEAARIRSPETMAEIDEAANGFADTVGKGSAPTTELMRLDTQFHQCIARSSTLSTVSGLLDALDKNVVNPHRLTMSAPGRSEEAVHQHRAITEAIRAGDPVLARTAAILHVETLVDRVLHYGSELDPNVEHAR